MTLPAKNVIAVDINSDMSENLTIPVPPSPASYDAAQLPTPGAPGTCRVGALYAFDLGKRDGLSDDGVMEGRNAGARGGMAQVGHLDAA